MASHTKRYDPVKKVGQGIASLGLAFYLSACATNIHVPEEAVTTASYATSLMQSPHISDQVQGHLVFMHYAIHHGGQDLGPYFESSPELALIWNDYSGISHDERDEVKKILEEVDFNRPATRVKAIEELALILPSFKRLEDKLDTKKSADGSGLKDYPDQISVYRDNQGKLIFDITPGPAG